MIIWIDQLYESGIEGQVEPTLSLPFDAVDSQATTGADGGLAAVVAHRCGFGYRGNQAAGLNANQEQELGIYLDEGYRTFLVANEWSFARPTTTSVLWKSTTATTTMTVGGEGNKTLTASASTFYPTMVGHSVVSTNGSYVIDGYVSATVVTVATDASDDDGLAFQVVANGSYRMPDDFGGLIGDVYYQANDSRWFPLASTGVAELLDRQQISTTTGAPTVCAVNSLAIGSTGQRHDLMVWPIPETTYTIKYQYHVLPDALSSGVAAYGGMMHAETLKYACLSAVERSKYRVVNGPDDQQFQRLLALSIKKDNNTARAGSLGRLTRRTDGDLATRLFPQATNVTVGGTSYP